MKIERLVAGAMGRLPIYYANMNLEKGSTAEDARSKFGRMDHGVVRNRGTRVNRGRDGKR